MNKQPHVKFKWDTQVQSFTDVSKSDIYVWAVGVGYKTPDFYKTNGRVQGIGGWWVTIPNQGFKTAFKISAPQPSGYINFTPDRDNVHISGGFGWVGERPFEEAELLLTHSKQQFVAHLSRYLNIAEDIIDAYGVSCCVRPSTPTGMPDINEFDVDGNTHYTISGAGKAGATQAPLIGLFIANKLGAHVAEIDEIEHGTELREALLLLSNGFEPKKG